MAAVRYIVSNVDQSVAFYRDRLGFAVDMQAPGFAALTRGDLRLFMNVPGAGSAGKAGGNPKSGGWNRFQIETDDLNNMIRNLRDVAGGAGGRQVLLEDPSGNVIELFEPVVRSK